MKGGSVEFDYEWEPPQEDAESIILSVSADILDYDPGCFYMSNGDPGYPPEGGEIENMVVTFPDGSFMMVIPGDLYKALCDKATDEHNDHGGC